MDDERYASNNQFFWLMTQQYTGISFIKTPSLNCSIDLADGDSPSCFWYATFMKQRWIWNCSRGWPLCALAIPVTKLYLRLASRVRFCNLTMTSLWFHLAVEVEDHFLSNSCGQAPGFYICWLGFHRHLRSATSYSLSSANTFIKQHLLDSSTYLDAFTCSILLLASYLCW